MFVGTISATVISCSNQEAVFIVSKIRKEENKSAIQRQSPKHQKFPEKINDTNLKSLTTETKIQTLVSNTKETNANPSFINGPIFSKSPRAVKDADLTVDNLGLRVFKDNLSKLGGKIVRIKAINNTRDDSKGTMDVELYYKYEEITRKTTIKVYNLLKTKDIELDANDFSTIGQIISAIDSATSLSFTHHVSVMTPQQLKDELVDLQKNLAGGSLTIIGKYKDSKQVVAFQRKQMLTNLINSFGDVSKTKRISGWFSQATSVSNIIGAIGLGGSVALFGDYGSDIAVTGTLTSVTSLVGALPKNVIQMFPELLNMFQTVANAVKNMDIVKKWAKDHDVVEQLKNIDHLLVQFVLNSGKK